MQFIDTIESLEALYGAPGETSLVKVADHITPQYEALLRVSPFAALATAGPEGLDCSPRGDPGAVAIVEDEKTLLIPDRRGNNRIDSLRNIVRDPRIALLCLIPGQGMALRINGRARLTANPDLLERLAIGGKQPRTVIVMTVEAIYFQCARAVLRAGLWDADNYVETASLPSAGDILQAMSGERINGTAYDIDFPLLGFKPSSSDEIASACALEHTALS